MSKVFQYGSNVSFERLNDSKRLNGSAKFIGVVKTVDKFEFDFTVWSKQNECAVADILPDGSEHIWGALYEIPENKIFRHLAQQGIRCLDQIEGEGHNYERIRIELSDSNGNHIIDEVFTYVVNASKRKFDLKTSSEYSNHILVGLSKLDVPSKYIDYIKTQIDNRL